MHYKKDLFWSVFSIALPVQSHTERCQTGYVYVCTMSLSFESLFQLLSQSFQVLWLI